MADGKMSMGAVMNSLFGTQVPGVAPAAAVPSNTTPAAPLDKAAINTNNNQNQNNPGLGGKNGNPEGAPDGKDPNASPLDAFAKLWETPPTDPNKPKPAASVLDVDPKALMDSAKKIDFTKMLSPETLQGIAKGGEDGMRSFAQAIQEVSQTLTAQNGLTTAQIVKAALAEQQKKFLAELPGIIKQHGFNNDLRTKHPVLSHPAAKPIGDALSNMLAKNNPNATQAELQEMADSYLVNFSEAFLPKKKDEGNATPGNGADGQDWTNFLPAGFQ